MLNINSIYRGIVIDHIKPGYGFSIFNYLKLDKADFRVALIMNAQSGKYGKKDMIKIENEINIDLAVLGFIDPKITINIIEGEKIKEKIKLTLPSKVEDIVSCKNPRCISGVEPGIKSSFTLVDKDQGLYRCSYCDHIYSWEG